MPSGRRVADGAPRPDVGRTAAATVTVRYGDALADTAAPVGALAASAALLLAAGILLVVVRRRAVRR